MLASSKRWPVLSPMMLGSGLRCDFLLWRPLVFSTLFVLVRVGLHLTSWTMVPPPRSSSFALWGAWFTTTATQMVTPRCVLTALALSLVFLWVLTGWLATDCLFKNSGAAT